MQGKHISDHTRDIEIRMLSDGHHYRDICREIGVSYVGIVKRNVKIYKIDCIDAFRKRVKRDGVTRRVDIPDSFGYWFSGWIDGEGHFGLHSYNRDGGLSGSNLSFQVKIRDDDFAVIEHVKNNLGVGTICKRKNNGRNFSNPTITYKITNVKDLAEVIVPIFEKYPLFTKKRKEFLVWREAVLERYILTMGGQAKIKGNGSVLDKFETQIKAIRAYKDGNE